MTRARLFALMTITAVVLALGSACGPDEESAFGETSTEARSFSDASSRSIAPDGLESAQSIGAAAGFAPSVSTAIMEDRSGAAPGASTDTQTTEAQEAAQDRLIVRVIDMTVEVPDISRAIEQISTLAVNRGGWVVSTRQPVKHRGQISLRVPRDQLDETVRTIRALALDVTSENATSQDVTAEYVDVEARIRNLLSTQEALTKLLSRTGELKDILEVQRELTNVSGQIEQLQGQQRYLEQTSSTSLINAWLELAALVMPIHAGGDRVAVSGDPVSFRATFTPLEDIEDFVFTWDFGDGTAPVTGTRTAPTGDGTERVTGTVRHVFESDEESPYIVTVEITGTGDGGIAEGDATNTVTVVSIPRIQISTGQSQTVRADDDVSLSGSFTRPPGITNLTYEWNFGDGLSPATGSIGDDDTTVDVVHRYTIDRGRPYEARLTLRGETELGAMVEESAVAVIYVQPSSAWAVGIWDIAETARTATRTLGLIVQTLFALAIWLVILSPILAAIAVGVYAFWRWGPRMPTRPAPDDEPPAEDTSTTSEPPAEENA